MGVRERVVRELVCDVCKKEIAGREQAKVGQLSARTQGARGRGEQWEMAFHPECYTTLVGTAGKPGGGARATRGRPRGRAAAAARGTAGGGAGTRRTAARRKGARAGKGAGKR